MTQPTMLIDLDRCVGCHSCTVACQTLHAAPPETRRMNLYQIGPFGVFPCLEMHYLPVMCQHCQDPPCVAACPTGATRKNEDGIVWVREADCTGCGECVTACPYQARYINPRTQMAESCNYCLDRELEDGQPFCARSCPAGALRLCDLDNLDPISAQWLQSAGENRFHLNDKGDSVGPRAIYILRRQPWAGREKIAEKLRDRD